MKLTVPFPACINPVRSGFYKVLIAGRIPTFNLFDHREGKWYDQAWDGTWRSPSCFGQFEGRLTDSWQGLSEKPE